MMKLPRMLLPLGCVMTLLTAPAAHAAAGSLRVTLATNTVSESAVTNGPLCTVERVGVDNTAALAVQATSIGAERLILPGSLTIPAGSKAVSFVVETINNGDIDGDTTVTLRFSADGFAPVSLPMTVTDDDTPARHTMGGRLAGVIAAGDYAITSGITVEPGRLLTLSPGASLKFAQGMTFHVSGSLTSAGTAANPIVFTGDGASPTNGMWDGIRIENAPGSIVALDHVEIAYGIIGIRLVQGSDHPFLMLSHADIHHSLTNGVRIAAGQDIPGNDQVVASNRVQITDCRIHDNGGHGVDLFANAYPCGGTHQAATVAGNDIFNNGQDGVSLYVNFTQRCNKIGTAPGNIENAIMNNTIHGNQNGIFGYGGVFDNARGKLSPLIVNNLITGNRANGIVLSGPDLSEINAKVINNTIVQNGGIGIAHQTNLLSGFLLENNVVALNRSGIAAVRSFASDQNVPADHNDVWGNNGDDWVNYPAPYGLKAGTSQGGAAQDAFGNLYADPKFVVDGLDFHLSVNSPLIDAGAMNSAAVMDFDGVVRNGMPDIGYAEFRLPAPSLSISSPAFGELALEISGAAGMSIILEVSSNLTQWRSLTNVTLSGPVLTIPFLPPQAAGAFIRAKTQ